MTKKIVPLEFPPDEPQEDWRLVRVKVGTPGGHGSWVETNHPAVVACMDSVPACASNGCQARVLERQQADADSKRRALIDELDKAYMLGDSLRRYNALRLAIDYLKT